jgi:hypothetical protein
MIGGTANRRGDIRRTIAIGILPALLHPMPKDTIPAPAFPYLKDGIRASLPNQVKEEAFLNIPRAFLVKN